MVLRPARGAGIARAALAAAIVMLATFAPRTAGAVPPPPPSLLPGLAARCDSAQLVRVETRRSSKWMEDVRLEADAVVLPGLKHTAFIELGTPPEKLDKRIPWAEVERVSIGRSRTAQGLLVGSLVGVAVGSLVVGVYGTDLAEEGDNAVLAFAALVGLGCAGIGLLVGSGHPEWTPLYP